MSGGSNAAVGRPSVVADDRVADGDANARRFTERYDVAVNYDGWRADRFLADQMRRASRAKVSRIIKAAARMERADGTKVTRVKSGTVVRTGDVVFIDRVERADPATPALDQVRVLHEDAELVVLLKPPGMLVHRTAHEVTRTIDAFLATRFPDETVECSHRIDRDTSGLLVCGRGLDSIRALVALFESGSPEKTYRTVVLDPDNRWPLNTIRRFDIPLGLDPNSSVKIRVGEGGWTCATTCEVVRRHGDLAELRVGIERGRQHQIRAHLSLFGTPVVGDKLYGMGNDYFEAWLTSPGEPTLVAQLQTRWHCLHAERLRLPWHGVEREFEAPVPAHWPEFEGSPLA